MGKLYTGLFFEAFSVGEGGQNFEFFAHFTKRYNCEDISFNSRARIGHKQAVTGLGQELSYILLTAGGDNSIASPDILSTSNSSDTCDIPGSLLQQRGPLGRQASIC